MHPTLHYVHDPLCGWCYAAEPLLDAVHRMDTPPRIAWHAGLLFDAVTLSPEMREHIRWSDLGIAQLSGQPFAPPYLDGLLRQPELVYDSAPPIRALLAAESLRPGATHALLRAIQHAHYEHGLTVRDPAVLQQLAEQALQLDGAAFAQAYERLEQSSLLTHVQHSRHLLQAAGGRGYPSFLWQATPEHPPELLDHQAWYGHPQGFARALQQRMAD